MKGGAFEMTSIVSVFTGAGIVQLRWNSEGGQLTPVEARTLALQLLETAEAAESDAAVVAFLQETGLSQEDAAGCLLMLRSRRDPR